MATRTQLPPFLRIPLEVRLLIFEHLLIAETCVVPGVQNMMCMPDYHEYEKSQEDAPATSDNILSFRNVIPPNPSAEEPRSKCRTNYKIRSDRFRARCIDVTYGCINLPLIHASVLGVNRQIHNEAASVLYGSYIFDFDSNVEACAPFIMDLTPFSRSCIRRMAIVKRALPYDKDFDRCEWYNMCSCIANQLDLTTLGLGVVSGKPIMGWENIEPYPDFAFDSIVQKHKRDEMQWVRDLMSIRGLQQLMVRACIEHCPPPGSDAMRFFVEFSASVERGFSSYLKSRMIPRSLQKEDYVRC